MSLKAIGACLLALAAVPASAHGAALSWDGNRYTFNDTAGQYNDLKIDYGQDEGGFYIEFDDNNPIELGASLAGQDCATVADSSEVRCDQFLNPLIELGGDDDNFNSVDLAGPEEVHGGPGNDDLKGWGGDDVLDGGPGDDEFEKGSPFVRNGNDLIVGGDGLDEMYYRGDYGAGPDPVTVTLDGAANDGPAGQRDNVQVEWVIGGEAGDTLTGGPGPDRLSADRGDDVLRGGGGNDFLDGDVGNDRLFGEDGDDELRGGDSSDDFMDGGRGKDKFIADGPCYFIGCDSGGEDEIQARDGFQDIINCGGGVDRAVVDSLDRFDQGGGFCELVDRAAGPGAGASFKLTARSSVRWAVLSRRGFVFTVECPGPCSIDARLFVSRRTAKRFNLAARRSVRVGRGRKSLRRAGKVRVKVKLTRKAKRHLRRARRLSLTLRVKMKDPAGATSSKRKKVRVRR